MRSQKGLAVGDKLTDIQLAYPVFSLTGKAQKLTGQVSGLFGDLADTVQTFAHVGVVCIGHHTHIHMSEDGVDAVVEIMGNASGKDAQRFQSLRMEKLFRQRLFFCGGAEFFGDIASHKHHQLVVIQFDRRQRVVDLPHMIRSGIQFAFETDGVIGHGFKIKGFRLCYPDP